MLIGGRHRGLIALLALDAERPVSRTRLVDGLWGDNPPRTATKTLNSHLARVRQALADCGLPDVLTTWENGYCLQLPRSNVDVHRFEEQVAVAEQHARSGEFAAAEATLQACLDLWRGSALADASPFGWAAAEVARLHEVRLTATEAMWEAALACGRHSTAVSELERLLVDNPGRERLAGLHMLALYRSGRYADAIAAYQRLRERLVEDLGLDPGPELQDRYAAMLRRDKALDLSSPTASMSPAVSSPSLLPSFTAHTVRRPAQLPAPVGHFTGRADSLAMLDRLTGDPADESRIAAIHGPAGVGKTALAVHWAHTVADRFGGGLLFLDLLGHTEVTATSTGHALARLLRALGVPGDRIPADDEELVGLYRSLTHNQPILILLDNAYSADQVLPLVPATNAGLLLVTSRQRLTGLATHHAVTFASLDVLSHADAETVLRRVIGSERADQEQAAVAEVARLCGYLPLALRIAAARLAADPGRAVARLAVDLANRDRLDELSVPGDSRSVRAAFATVYHALSQRTAVLFRRLGLHPGQSFDAHLAAAICGVGLDEAERGLSELVQVQLVTEAGPHRYRFHDLIRLYAAECAVREEPPAGIEEATQRLFDWYLAVAQAANRVIGPARDRVEPDIRHSPAELPFTPAGDDRHDEVLAYLDGEHGNMTAVVRHAAEHGREQAAWQLTYLLTGFFEYRGHWTDRLELCEIAVAASERLGDPFAEGLMHGTLGVACVQLHRYETALTHLRRSLARMRSIGDSRGQGVALNNMAVAYTHLGQLDGAVESFERALEIHRQNRHAIGIALALNNIGYVYAKFGKTYEAVTRLNEALEAARELGNARIEAIVLNSLGQAHLYAENYPAALELLTQSLALRREIGDRRGDAETLHLIGLAHLRRDEFAMAIDRLQTAYEISRAIADEEFEAKVLTSLGEATLRMNELASAIEHLDRALDLRSRNPDAGEEAAIHRLLAQLYDQKGDRAAAVHHRRLAAVAAGPVPH